MVRYNKKFFFDENSKPAKTPKIKEPKVKKVKEPKVKKITEPKKTKVKKNKIDFSLYLNKLIDFIKKWFLVIIGIIIVIILIFIIKGCTSNSGKKKTKEPEEIKNINPVVVDSITINLNQEVPDIDSFVKNYSKIKTKDDLITYDQTNFVNNKYNSVGEYKVTITLNGKEYLSRIVVIDKEPPVFAVKEVIITEGTRYTINDFVSSCSDNSGKECTLNYKSQDFANLTIPGTYQIPIVATDLSGNAAEIKYAKLTINAKPVTPTPKPKTCTYGSTKYTSNHVLTYSLVKNNCPVAASYAKTDTYISTPEKMARESLEKLKTEIQNKNISMKIYFQLNVVPILNNEGTGLVGYAAYINGYEVTSDNKTGKTVISFDINQNGTRKYIINELGL